MDSPTALVIIRWMVSLTFRQALASRLFWAVSAVTVLAIVLCLSVRVHGPPPLPVEDGEVRLRLPAEEFDRISNAQKEGVDSARSELRILFGTVRVSYRHYPDDAVRFLQFVLAGIIASTAGVLLALVWTAGFLPEFLAPANVTVLLGKPVPRWSLLLGKYLGVVGFVALQAIVFVLGTWIALGLRTGVWAPAYLLCLPVLVMHFAVFFSVSAGLAVLTRSAVVSMIGVLAFWMVCWTTNHSWHAWHNLQATDPGVAVPWLVEIGYWGLPKPADLNWLLADLLRAQDHFGKILDYRALDNPTGAQLGLSVLTSLLFTAGALTLSVRRFATAEY
jgi:ABC-type transport system involved in multi-copper enzyme maturation permease subunit